MMFSESSILDGLIYMCQDGFATEFEHKLCVIFVEIFYYILREMEDKIEEL